MNNTVTRNPGEVMRDEMVMNERILSLLAEEPRTVPEIAAVLGCSAHDTMLWIASMWRYGSVEEVGKPGDEGYYKYKTVVE